MAVNMRDKKMRASTKKSEAYIYLLKLYAAHQTNKGL